MTDGPTRGSAPDHFEVDGQLLRQTMGGFATGVTIITTQVDDEPHGMTVNSLTSVSLEPPLLLVCFTRDSRTCQAVQQRGWFVVNILSKRQEALSNRFAKPGEDHFEGGEYHLNELGLPVIPRTLGHLVCEVDTTHLGGDHLILMGRVVHCGPSDGTPLVFYRGRYHGLTGRGREAQLWYW